MSSSAITQFETLQQTSDFIFAVFYRGHWCPFCISYLKDLQSISSSIVASHGTPVAITSELSANLPETRKRSGYTSEILVDTENSLAADLKAKGLLDVAISEKKGYEYGMAQPAVLVMKRDGTVLYDWAIVPGMMNLGGATDRPSLKEIWEDVEKALKGKGTKISPRTYSKQTFVGVMMGKVFG